MSQRFPVHSKKEGCRQPMEPLSELGEKPDQLEEACAVFGAYAPGEDVARLTCFGLQALQHRGQESAGIAVGDGDTILIHKDLASSTRCSAKRRSRT